VTVAACCCLLLSLVFAPSLDTGYHHRKMSSTDGASITSSDNQSRSSWETSERDEGIVHVDDGLQLFLSAHGPPRTNGQPAVVFISGAGVGSAWWSAVVRQLAPVVRSYRYDRAGLGRSPPSATPRTAERMAQELLSLLAAARIRPPYLLVAHSYGGIIARELLAASADAVMGMVLVDALQELSLHKLRPPFDEIAALSAAVNYAGATGLLREHKGTASDLTRVAEDQGSPSAADTTAAERALFGESSHALASKRQFETHPLGLRPVTVIRGDNGWWTLPSMPCSLDVCTRMLTHRFYRARRCPYSRSCSICRCGDARAAR